MPTYRLTLEYEGTRYRGWQEQTNARTVAGEIRRALETIGAPLRELGGAGRTDAGVHALAQVAHLRLGEAAKPEALRRALNDVLPPDIHLLALEPAPERFHARHAAVTRSYVYQISRRRSALGKRFVWWIKRPLDVDRLGGAAALLPGLHDCRHFCERPDDQPSTKVLIERVEVAEEGALILVRLAASHFLWKMVRRVVGSLVEVAAGDLAVDDFAALLAAGPLPDHAHPARTTAPPSGLFLERVLYEGDPPLGDLRAPVPVAAGG